MNLDEVMEDVVNRKETTSLIAGGRGVGKTHLAALLMKMPCPSKRVSTPCAEIPPWLLKCLQVQKDSTGVTILTDEMHTALKKDDQIFGRIVDIGGHPQLLELLPRFVSNITLGAIVVNLSQGLDKYPTSYFYGKDGNPIGRGIRSNLTNEQIMRVFLLMIASLSTEQKRVKIIIIGTHRDVEWKCKESRQTKEDKIQAIISSFKLEENIIYKTKSSLIFDVNAKNPKNCDRHTAEKIMEIMMNKEFAVEVSIPVKHHKLELTAQMLLGTERIAVPFDELYSNMKSHYVSPSAITEGLEFLNKSFRLFYFKEIPKLVFGRPQRLLNLMTEITVCHIRLTTNEDKTKTCDGMWNQFKKQAIVSEKILEKISNCYNEDFTAKQMLEVMEKLSITCKLQEGEYLMPSLLTALATLPQSQSSWWKWLPFGLGDYLQKLISGMESDITMLAYFPDGLSRFGVYCGTVCTLISDYKWELFGEVSRNQFQFTQPNNLGIISFVDSFDSFFIVNLDKVPSYFSSDKLASLCSKICHTIFSAIKQVTKNMGYTAKDPEVAFLCDHDNSPHVAEYLFESDCLRCVKNKQYTKQLTPKNKFWLQREITGNKEDLPPSQATQAQVSKSGSRDLPVSETAHSQVLSSDSEDRFVSETTPTQGFSSGTRDLSTSPTAFSVLSSTSEFKITMNKLSLLKWTNREQKECRLCLIEEISPDWKKVSDLLGLTPNHTKRIEKNCQTVEDRCREVMAEWLSNEHSVYQYPRSWEGLCQLLDDMNRSTLAENLQNAILLVRGGNI